MDTAAKPSARAITMAAATIRSARRVGLGPLVGFSRRPQAACRALGSGLVSDSDAASPSGLTTHPIPAYNLNSIAYVVRRRRPHGGRHAWKRNDAIESRPAGVDRARRADPAAAAGVDGRLGPLLHRAVHQPRPGAEQHRA